MNQLLERLTKLNNRMKTLAVLGIYVLILVVFFVGCYKPQTDTRSDLREKNSELTKERDDKETKANNKEEFERQLEELDEELARMVRQLPEDQQIPELLDSVSQVGRKLGLDFVTWKSQREILKDFYAEVPVELEVDGSYHDVAMFFDKIANLDRIINVRDIRMGTPEEQGGKVVVRTKGGIVAFRQLTVAEQERLAQEAEEAKKNSRRRGRK